jgi:gliding motility-associated-like protein
VQLTAALPGATAYQWNTGATTSTLTVTQAGTYRVTVFYGANCLATAQRTVRAAVALPAFTLGTDTTLCDQDSMLLRGPALDPRTAPVTYRWSDGSTAPVLQVRLPGRYALTISTACETRTATRLVTGRSCLLIPNIITPNGDGLNDVFTVRGLPPGPWALTVYNRWGVEVYHVSDYRSQWGAGVAPGTYYYLLRHARQGMVYKGWVQAVL